MPWKVACTTLPWGLSITDKRKLAAYLPNNSNFAYSAGKQYLVHFLTVAYV